jgi:hypothetical protein
MATLTTPSLERRLLQTVTEELEAEPVRNWPKNSLQLCLDMLRGIGESADKERRLLQEVLASGVEARSFSSICAPGLAVADDIISILRKLVGQLTENDAGSQSLVAEARVVEKKYRAMRDLLAEALARARETRRPVDWLQVRAAEEAHERGEMKPFSRR